MIKFIEQLRNYQVLMSSGRGSVVIKIIETQCNGSWEGYSALPRLQVRLIVGITTRYRLVMPGLVRSTSKKPRPDGSPEASPVQNLLIILIGAETAETALGSDSG